MNDATASLDDCGCCMGLQEPPAVDNAPGLPALRYRVDTQPGFYARMLQSLPLVPSDPSEPDAPRPLAALAEIAADTAGTAASKTSQEDFTQEAEAEADAAAAAAKW